MSYSKIVLGIVAVGLVGSGLAWAQVASAPSAAATAPAGGAAAGVPKLRCDKPVFEFKEVWAGESVTATYIIHNDGKAPLEILSVKPSCGCTVAKYDKVIGPGYSGKVTANLRTKGMRTKIRKTIRVKSNDPKKPDLVLTLTGTVKPRIAIEPAAGANWGRVTAESDLTRKVKIVNNTDQPMKLEPIPLPKGRKSIFTTEMKELEPGKVVEMTVTANKPFNQGSNNAQLKYKTGIEGEKEVVIRCTLYSPPMLEVKPSMLPISAPVTRSTPRTVKIQYNGAGSMRVESVEATDKEIGLELKEEEPGRTYTVKVTIPQGFDPPASGPPLEIVVNTDLDNRRTIKVPVRVNRRPPRGPRQVQPRVPAESLVGKPAPRAGLRTADGKQVEISPNTGKVTVVTFWASWSPQSRRLLPVIQRVSNLYARKGVTFLNVSVDHLRPPSEVMAAAKAMDVSMSVAVDPTHSTAARYGVKAPPMVVLIGTGGVVEAIHKGGAAGPDQLRAFEDMLQGELDTLLSGKTRQDFAKATVVFGPTDTMDTMGGKPASNAAAPRLVVESLRQDAGSHKPGEAVNYKLYCRNDGKRALTLASVSASEGVTVAPGYTKILQPGATTALTCQLTVPKEPGEFSRSVTINSNDGSRSKLEVALAGISRSYLELKPSSGIDFGRNPRTQTMGRMATVTYNGEGPIEYVAAESSSPKFEVTVTKIGKTDNAKVIVNTKPDATFEIGEHTAVVRITTNCKEQPTIDVPVCLYRPARIELEPAEVVLSGVRNLQRRTVSIANNGMQALHVLGVESSSRSIRTQFYPDRDGFSYKLELTLPKSFKCGPQGEKVTIRTDDREFGEIVIPIRVGS